MAPLALAIAAALVPLLGHGVSRLVGVPFLDGSPVRLLALVVVSGALCLFVISSTMLLSAVEYILAFLDQGPGPDIVPFMLAGGFGAVVLGGLFLALASRTVPPADFLMCAAAGAGLGGFGRLLLADSLMVERLHVSAGVLPLFIVWQSGMAFVLAYLSEPSRQQMKSAARAYSAVAVALVALMFSWMVGRHAEAKPLGSRQPKVQVIERPLGETFIRQVGQLTMQGDDPAFPLFQR